MYEGLFSAVALTKDYMVQWAANNVYADEALIVPFPSLAIFDPDTKLWHIHIKAWLYLPFEIQKFKNYLSSLPSILTGKTEEKSEDSINQNTKKTDVLKNLKTLVLSEASKYKMKEEKLTTDKCIDEDAQCFDKAKEKPDRLSLFFVGTPAKAAIKCIIHDIEHLTKTSDEYGLVEEKLELPHEKIQTISKVIHPDSDDRQFDCEIRTCISKTDTNSDTLKTQKCTIYILASQGISVISDIDDTIKISKVLSIPSLLKNTFYDDFKPVNGMNELYQKWHQQKCQFHYVSASPWQLKYILVGDSGEQDAEVYAELYNTFSQSIAHIFIRDVCQTTKCLPQCQERYIKAFKDVPKRKWTVFKNPKTLETNIEKIIAI
ncbi:unnamed protein product [Rotaria sp. Silwood1]|nr:unnamed protein product [Rotaria sp. Silwood1]